MSDEEARKVAYAFFCDMTARHLDLLQKEPQVTVEVLKIMKAMRDAAGVPLTTGVD